MADNDFNNVGADGLLSTDANFSLAHTPTGAETMVLDSAVTSDNLTFDENLPVAGAIDGIRFDNAYAGTVDAATFDVDLGSAGLDCTGGAAATLDLGSGTWTITDGDFDYGDIGTFDDGSSTVVMAGTGQIIGKNANYLYVLQIAAGATISIPAASGTYVYTGSALTVNGSLDVATGKLLRAYGTWSIGAAGTLTGSGVFDTWAGSVMTGFASGGTIDIAELNIRLNSTILAGTYDSAEVTIGTMIVTSARTTSFGAGTYVFSGNVTWRNSNTADHTLDLATNNPNVTVAGDLTIDIDSTGGVVLDASSSALTLQGDLVDEITGAGTFTADSQDLTLDGTNDQGIDGCGGSWGLVTVNKASGTTTLSGDLDATGMLINSGASTFDAATFDVDLGSAGLDCTGGAAATLDLGSGTWTITGGPWDSLGLPANNLIEGTSTLVFKATCTWAAVDSTDFYNVIVFAGASVSLTGPSGFPVIYNDLTVNGTLTISSAIYHNPPGDLVINTGGSLVLSDSFFLHNSTDGHGLVTLDGTISGSKTLFLWDHAATAETLVAGDYSGVPVSVFTSAAVDKGWRASSGSYTFGTLKLQTMGTGSSTVDLSTNNPNVTVAGDLTIDIDSTGGVTLDASSNALTLQGDLIDEITGAGTFTADSQALILDGTNDQGIDGCGGTWGVWIILKTAAGNKVTLTGGFSCGEVSFSRGTLDLNGQTLDVSGDMTIAAGKGNSLEDLAGSTINCDNLVANGASGADLVGSATWYLNCTTSGTLHYLTITNCDASGGVEVDATNNCVDGGGNTNVKFVGAILPLINGGLINAGLIGGGLIR